MPLKTSSHCLKCFGLSGFMKILFIILSYLAFQPFYANSAINVDPLAINITGTVVANAACTFNGDKEINIEFGEVWIDEITGDNYKRTLPYTLKCEGDANGKSIQMRWVGTSAIFNWTLLKTDNKGLGIELRQNNKQVRPNTWFTIDAASPPQLDLVIVKKAGASLVNGQEFTASATLEVAYN